MPGRNRTSVQQNPQQLRRVAGPSTARGESTRIAIIGAAKFVFERHGYLDARVSDIATKAKVSHGSFYSYFTSKEAVFKAVVSEVLDVLMAHLAEPADSPPNDPVGRIRHANHRYLEAYRESAVIIGLLEQMALVDLELRELRLEAKRRFNARVARGIERMQADGQADKNLDPVLASEALGFMVDRTCYMWFVLGQNYDEEAMLNTLTTLWARGIGLSST